MAGSFDTRNISFHTPKTQWDPIFRYYNSILGTESGSIDRMPQVRVEVDINDPNKFVVQWSLGGFGRDIPFTQLKEYEPPTLEMLSGWLYSMEDTRPSNQKPYVVESAGEPFNFPRNIHDFALSALTAQGDALYLGDVFAAENINDPLLARALNMPYWGIRDNAVALARIAQITTRYRFLQGQIQLAELDQLLANHINQILSLERTNHNRPFWRVLMGGTAGRINPDAVSSVYDQNNPPPAPPTPPLPPTYIAPRTLGAAISTIYNMLSGFEDITDAQRDELLTQAVQEQIGIGLHQRYANVSSDRIDAPIRSSYFGSRIQTPFVVDSRSAEYLRLGNMSELAGSNYGLVKPTYNRYEPCLENAASYEGIDENNLVSFYTLMGSITYDILDNKKVPYDWVGTPPLGNFVYNKYQNISILSGSQGGGGVDINLLNISRTSISKYFKAYMNTIPHVPPADLSQLGSLYQRAKFPNRSSYFLTAFDFSQPLMPYYIQINLESGETGGLVGEINNSDLSSYILDKTQKTDFDRSLYTVGTDYINAQNSVVHGRKNIQLGEKTFKEVLGVSTNEGISDLSYNVVGKEATAGAIAGGFDDRAFDRLLQFVKRKSSSELLSYQDRVENRHFSATESLLDIISKTKGGSPTPIAKTYIASPTLQKVHQYTDTQVKYGEEYTYKNSKMNIAYGTTYSYKTLDITVPTCLLQSSGDPIGQDVPKSIFVDYDTAGLAVLGALPLDQEGLLDFGAILSQQVVGYSFCVEVHPADSRILDIPIYDQIYDTFAEDPRGVSFSPVSVRDYPPTPPVLEIRPIRGNYRQILINLNLEAISRTTTTIMKGPQCGDGFNYDSLHDYQKTFIDFNLEEGKLIFQNDGLSEITNVKVVRTDKLIASAYEAENPIEEAYKSFCEDTNPEAEIVVKSLDQEPGQVGAASYGFTDDIEPNKYYYYTAYSRDLRDNVSNPSEIYQVRLVYDKGLLSPEISLLNIEEIPNKTPVKKMTRFMEIKASGIQTQPFMNTNEDGEIESYKSLIYKAGEAGDLLDINDQQVTESDFVVRLTSKDTGRKFDIRLTINETHPIPDQGDPDSC